MSVESKEELVGASSVLVLADDADLDGADSPYADVIRAATGDHGTVILVTFDQPPDQRAESIREITGHPDDMRIVAVGDSARSAAARGGATVGPMVTVEHPDDLTELGIRLGQTLDEVEHVDDLVVCFHSLTALLDHTPVERAFRFLHVLTSRLNNAGATSFFHLAPGAHDPSDVATVQPLFDGILRNEDGEWSVIRR